MKKLIFIAALSITSLLVSCGDNNSSSQAEKEHEHGFQCSMKCEEDKIYDQEGTCPICGMDLTEVTIEK